MLTNNYQEEARKTAVYREDGKLYLIYPTLGLCGEAGEVANKIKKIFRDNKGIVTPEVLQDLKDELGDVLWYLSNCASDLGLSLNEIAENNIKKLKDRQERGTLRGSGDKR